MDPLKHNGTRSTACFHARLLVTSMVLIYGLAGCRYFRPASPELPSGDSFVPSYSSTEATLSTLQLAIQAKAAANGQSAYVGGFADLASDGVAYTAAFDPITVDRFPEGTSTDWDRGQEEIFYAKLSQLLPSSDFLFVWGEFLGAPDDDPQTSSAVLYRSYLLQATPDDGVTFVPVARGNVELHFAKIRDNWKIVRWVDSEDPEANPEDDELSFGHLRLAGP